MSMMVTERIRGRLEELGMTYLSAGLDSWLEDEGRKEGRTLSESVDAFIDIEWVSRQDRQARTRLKLSGMPARKSMDDFDLSWLKGGLTEKSFRELKSLAWVERKENVILMGPSGLGKTHLMLALGHEACARGSSVYHASCSDLMETLRKAREAGNLKRKLKWFRKANVLLIDELGYENLNPGDGPLFFQLINARYEHGSVVMTTNRPFSGWSELMGDDAVATATIDRLLHHAIAISLKGDSYRMKGRLKAGIMV